MSQAPTLRDDSPNSIPCHSVDWELYAAMLEEGGLSLEQQRKLIETLRSTVVMFVDLGFEVDPVRQICGQRENPLSDEPPDLLSLLRQEETDQSANEEGDIWQD